MCYTCGCKLPYEDHGDPRNVVETAFSEAGKTKQVDSGGAAAAKRNMLELLQVEERAGELAQPRKSYAEEKPGR